MNVLDDQLSSLDLNLTEQIYASSYGYCERGIRGNLSMGYREAVAMATAPHHRSGKAAKVCSSPLFELSDEGLYDTVQPGSAEEVISGSPETVVGN